MNLPGRLRLTTLGDVLGTLYREGATGVLELTESTGATAGRVHRVNVVGGLVGDVETSLPTPRLGELLERRGLLDAVALRRLTERLLLCSTGKRVGEILIDLGAVTPEEVAVALRVQRRERLERLFLLDDARLAFRVARGAAGEARRSPLEPREYLFGRPRSRDRGGRASLPTRREAARRAALSTLGLDERADEADVRRAFRQLATRMHPDRHPLAGAEARADLMRKFAEITAAYHALVA